MAYESKYTGSEVDTLLDRGEWFNLKWGDGYNSGSGRPPSIIIENFEDKLTDTDKYRFVLTFQKRRNGRLNYVVPMFGAIKGTQYSRPLSETYTRITSNIMPFAPPAEILTVASHYNTGKNVTVYHTNTTRNSRARAGYAIYKYTGVGTFGWHRVSNITGFELHVLQTGQGQIHPFD